MSHHEYNEWSGEVQIGIYCDENNGLCSNLRLKEVKNLLGHVFILVCSIQDLTATAYVYTHTDIPNVTY